MVATRARHALKAAAALAVAGLLTACGSENSALGPTNSFLDQTEMVKSNKAQDGLIVPILDHLNQQDIGIGAQFAGAGKVTADDLVVNNSDYVIGKNDLLSVSITDLVGPGIESVRQVRVTESGKISMPLVPQIAAAGLTEAQLEQAIVAAYRDANLISNAQVSVTVTEARARTFTISGAISAPGEYAIVRSDFRLLDALALAHEVTSTTGIDDIYVIRKSTATSGSGSTPAGAAMPASLPTTAPSSDPLAPRSEGPTTPGEIAHRQMSLMVMTEDPTTTPSDVGALPPPPTAGGMPATTPSDTTMTPAPAATPAGTGTMSTGSMSTGTMTTGGDMSGMTATTMPAAAPAATGDQEGRYVIVDGKPVLVDRNGTPTATTMNSGLTGTAALTNIPPSAGSSDFEFNAPAEPSDQRVIRIPVSKLRLGELKYNIVIRPGDYVYIPQPVIGEYYMGGHVLRSGVYSLTARKITLKEAFISAGMLDPVAIPARTQIIRRIDDKREVFAVVDIEKIFAGTEPDLILRPDDQVLVGTNIIAPFLAAFRNGFRITYGFGFLYDRNYYTGNNNGG